MPVIDTIDRISITRVVFAPPLVTCTPADPFLVDDPCPVNPAGHFPMWVHREIVCPHCSKVIWS